MSFWQVPGKDSTTRREKAGILWQELFFVPVEVSFPYRGFFQPQHLHLGMILESYMWVGCFLLPFWCFMLPSVFPCRLWCFLSPRCFVLPCRRCLSLPHRCFLLPSFVFYCCCELHECFTLLPAS